MHTTDRLFPASSTSFGKQLLFRSIFSFPYERLFEAGLFRSVFFHSETVGFANAIHYRFPSRLLFQQRVHLEGPTGWCFWNVAVFVNLPPFRRMTSNQGWCPRAFMQLRNRVSAPFLPFFIFIIISLCDYWAFEIPPTGSEKPSFKFYFMSICLHVNSTRGSGLPHRTA